MKILVLGNQARAMSNFWTVLLRRMCEAGHEVICLIPETVPGDDPPWEKALADIGVQLRHYPLDRKGLHPLRDVRTLRALWKICKQERPDRLFAYTVKPVIYGAVASALAGFPTRKNRHVMITGLGYMFEADTALKKILLQVGRLLYRLAFLCAGTVYFQNDDDRNLFEKLSILPKSIIVQKSKGTGVDLRRFATQNILGNASPLFLFVGRLLEAKGLRELAVAAEMVQSEYPDTKFQLLGPAEKGPGSVPLEQVLAWQRKGIVEYLGETQDVRPYLEQASVVVLPSWREGTPCSLMEAMSMGRAVIAADAPGSREVVRDGINGFLTPVRDASALADAIKRFIIDPSLAARMGAAGRSLMENEFSAERVADELLRSMDVEENFYTKKVQPAVY